MVIRYTVSCLAASQRDAFFCVNARRVATRLNKNINALRRTTAPSQTTPVKPALRQFILRRIPACPLVFIPFPAISGRPFPDRHEPASIRRIAPPAPEKSLIQFLLQRPSSCSEQFPACNPMVHPAALAMEHHPTSVNSSGRCLRRVKLSRSR